MVAQVALSVMLLVVAGLFLRTFNTLASIELGFQPDRVLIVLVDVRHSAFASPANERLLDNDPKLAALLDRASEAARSVPGVESAASGSVVPITGLALTTAVEVPGDPSRAEPNPDMIHKNVVGPDSMGTRLLSGRDFETRDRVGTPPVAIVNETFAARFFNGHVCGKGRRQTRLPLSQEVGQALVAYLKDGL